MPPELDLELTLEQQFQLQLVEKELANMSPEKMKDLLLKTTQMLMVKDNAIRSLAKKLAHQ